MMTVVPAVILGMVTVTHMVVMDLVLHFLRLVNLVTMVEVSVRLVVIVLVLEWLHLVRKVNEDLELLCLALPV